MNPILFFKEMQSSRTGNESPSRRNEISGNRSGSRSTQRNGKGIQGYLLVDILKYRPDEYEESG